jgi:hypothetical protein
MIKIVNFIASALLILLAALIISISDFNWPEETNYIGLTEPRYPDIAIDMTIPEHKLSRKQMTDRR